ncbi:hypothetical protein HZF24_01680 [Sedimentibacter hydroxybenzoicus DSM 7310]|uniref:Uncharacterized protein n=1 Tax=Sedimentibacter hydroxybenzoicus DSM 7310 TaxID=1123245 RepID=A0A974BHM1_SEDHY|nr:hypothetical protein [Sedimentibacter hydroxybenzoicus]NYB72845.1 hypothetical protein [Sedimentibacter hydroxybenzoicus DSM 7310]
MTNVNKENIYRNLLDAGCSRDFADDFIHLEDKQKKMKLLSCHRCSLLDKIHEYQKQLDCLDYLIYSTKNK